MSANSEGAKTSDIASLTLQDVAKLLQVTPAHARSLVVSGRLKASNVATDQSPGKRARWRVSPAAILAFQAASSNQPQPQLELTPSEAATVDRPGRPAKGEEFV